MRKKLFFTILSLTSLILALGASSCCSKCKEGKSAYSASNGDSSAMSSGEIIGGVRVIKMTAKQFEYDPSTIRINQGEKVRLEITTKDVTHGFGIKEYKIDSKIEPDKTTVIEFTADKAGSFEFHCTSFCGMGHFGMKGKLVVSPK